METFKESECVCVHVRIYINHYRKAIYYIITYYWKPNNEFIAASLSNAGLLIDNTNILLSLLFYYLFIEYMSAKMYRFYMQMIKALK